MSDIEFAMLQKGDLIYLGAIPCRIVSESNTPPLTYVAEAEGGLRRLTITVADCARVEKRYWPSGFTS